MLACSWIGFIFRHGMALILTADCIHIFPKIGNWVAETTGESPSPALPHRVGKGDFLTCIVVNTTFFPSPFDGEGGRPQAGRVRIQASHYPSPEFPPCGKAVDLGKDDGGIPNPNPSPPSGEG